MPNSHAAPSLAATALLLLSAACLRGQIPGQNPTRSPGPAEDPQQPTESRGEAQLTLQGYYQGAAGSPLTAISGVSGNTSVFLPGLGLLTGSLEGYESNGFHTGNIYVGLQGVSLLGWHWDLTAGDVKFSSSLTPNPFNNVLVPEISARGVQLAMKRTNSSYQFFFGQESALGGPRIPYRTLLPQTVMGATMQRKLTGRWLLGAKYLHLSTSSSVFSEQTTYSLPGHSYLTADSLVLQSTYSIIPGSDNRGLKVYAEAGLSGATSPDATPGRQVPVSFLAGPSWETERFSVKANYVQQSSTYMPLLGLFAGDRKGAYGEARYRPFPWLTLYGSGSLYSNNLEDNPSLPTFHSKSYGGGASLSLPWKFSLAGSVSTVMLNQNSMGFSETPSNNQQMNLSVGRSMGRHSLRMTLTDLKLDVNGSLQHQRLTEAGDNFAWKWFAAGFSMRMQQATGAESKTTLFYRGSLQLNYHRLSLYGNMDLGSDLLNQSVFSTSTFNTTVMGVSAPLRQGWTLHAEAFRNTLNTALNPENAFLFGSTGIGANTQLAALNQWSVLFRVTRNFHWGKDVPGDPGLAQYAASRVPLVGTVRGMVMETSLAGPRPAASVAVSIDNNRTTTTDSSGYYQFTEVPEGTHEIALNMEQLPADYEPGTQIKKQALLAPRGTVRADFSVYRLTGLTGIVAAPKEADLQDVIIRLKGTSAYTTPYIDGSFSFSNLREGPYEIEVEGKTIPEGYELASAPRIPVDADASAPTPAVRFELRQKSAEVKPVREMKLQSQPIRIH